VAANCSLRSNFSNSILLGYLYYKSQKKRLLNDKSLELSAIADLKVKQIAQWRNERISDAVLIGENTPFLKLLSEYLHGTNDKILRPDIIANMKSITRSAEYKNILLIDSTGIIRGYYPNQDTLIFEYINLRFRI
jgi:hypothetical protein